MEISFQEKLKRFSIFKSFDDSILSEICEISSILKFKKDEIICNEQNSSNSMFFIFRGIVKVYKDSVLLSELYEGEYFGEMSLIEQSKIRSATVSANSDVELIEINQECFNKYIKNSNDALYNLLLSYDKRLRDNNHTVVGQFNELKLKYGELKETHQQLLQTEKLASIGMITAGIAHEINNPLTVIIVYLQLLREELGTDKKGEEYYKNIYNKMIMASNSIQKIVNGIKSYVRMDDEKTVPVMINKTIQDSIDLMSFLYKKDNIEIKTNYNKNEIEILGNVGQLQQVIINLLSNAKDAMENSKTKCIKIETLEENDLVYIKVSDSGCGIPKENLDKVFKKFWTSKAIGKGTGLGLDIVQTIVNKIKGDISVESILGEGTTFIIKVPVVKAQSN